jgi:predicted membrane-bound mannosyltransferase/DNA-binding beta-propeller fold protein YncE
MNDTITETQPEKSSFLSKPLIASLNLDWEKAIYILFLILAIITRFYILDSRVMSHDESLHTQFSYQYFRGDGFSHTPLMHGPFLFHITPLFYWLLGDSDFSARVPVAIFGVLLVVLIPYLLRPWLGRVGALFTSFLFLISPYLLYYSRYIRHDIYVIAWAMMIFIATWYFLEKGKDKSLWWFAAGLALMFSTKEVAFIYVAIFGSYLIIRLLPQLLTAEWFPNIRRRLVTPLLIAAVGLLLIGGGLVGVRLADGEEEPTTAVTEPFASDPNETPATTSESSSNTAETALRWLQIGGIFLVSAGLLMGAQAMRPHLDKYREFDLIMLYTTLILPMASPLLVTMAGWNPRDYTFNRCMPPGVESAGTFQALMMRLTDSTCYSAFFQSGMVKSGGFLLLTLGIAVAVGLWWNRRRWLIAAAIFYTLFTVLYTSFFTNPAGWTSGMIGSLGYWLEQQEVQRGNQPWFYYLFVTPFYEFLPLLFSLLAIRLWFIRQRINRIVGYWLVVVIFAGVGFSLVNWVYNSSVTRQNMNLTQITTPVEPSSLPGLVAALVVLGLAVLVWFLYWRGRIQKREETDNLLALFNWRGLLEFAPYAIWWMVLTWAAYSYAGEKMPWLSTHFVMPMAILAGWYFNEKLADFDGRTLFSRNSLLYLGLSIIALVALALAVGPILLGIVQWGDQTASNLRTMGRVLGSFLLLGIIAYLWWTVRARLADGRLRSALWSLSIFAILSLLTIRSAYLATYPNGDYAREFLVYAHGAPAAKSIVLDQVSELSQRLYGDNSIRVAYGGSGVPWPFTWYMREYPNAVYYGENPSADLNDSPIIIAGRTMWDQLDSILGANYDYNTYTYLWWPMEDYRQINWNALLGDPNRPEGMERRGLLNAGVRQAIWDIWFYRNYERYDEVFGRNHTAGQWPLRDDLRLYIRNDVATELWDYGLAPASAEVAPPPFTEGDLGVLPTMVLHPAGFPSAAPGEFLAPRNVAVAGDGRIFVLDSGNQRVQVFSPEGEVLYEFGGPGSDNGEFNMDGQGPWGIDVDDEFVYVADTWNHRMQVFTHAGDFVASYGTPGDLNQAPDQGLGIFFGPRDVAHLADGRLLVTDTGNHRVQIISPDGLFLGQLGSGNGQFGSGPGQFYEPVSVAVDANGNIYVTDTWNGRVQQFSPDFFPINEWPVPSWAGNFSINNKPYIATDSAGRVYVTDPENYRVLIFSPAGDYLGKFGQFGTDVNSMGLPTGIHIDDADNIYVADAGNNRILKYAPIFAPAFTPATGLEDEAIEEEAVEEESVEEEAVEEEVQPEEVPTETETGAEEPTATGSSEEEPEPTPTANE